MQCKRKGDSAALAAQECPLGSRELSNESVGRAIDASRATWRWSVGGLLLLALALRVLSAVVAHPIRPDSVHYIHTAENLAEGRFSLAFSGLGPNLYPAILIGLKQLGLDYETAGRLWGVFISTITLLPLLGLVRMMFGRKLALISGFLYAVHPRFIEWGPELMRDPTFWFCFLLALYAIHKAYNNGKTRWFLLAGVGFLAAIHLRIEGWLLLFPFAVLAASRLHYPAIRRRLRQIAIGAAIVLVAVAGLCYANGTWSDEAPIWGRFHGMVALIQSKLGAAGAAAQAAMDYGRPPERQVVHFFKKYQKAVVPWLLVPALVGVYRLRRRMWSAEYAADWGIALLNLAMVAAYLAIFSEINTRYFMTGTLLLFPYMAYGTVVIVRHARRFLRAAAKGTPAVRWAAPVAAMLLITGGLSGVFVDRSALLWQYSVGTWIRANYGEDTKVAYWRPYSLVEYYANASQTVLLSPDQQQWEETLQIAAPDIVLANLDTEVGRSFRQYVEQHPEFGYRLLERFDELTQRDVLVYVRQATREIVAQGAAGTSGNR